jgi:hypothetical protein
MSVISNIYRKTPDISILLSFGPSTLKSKSDSSPRPSFLAILAAPSCRSLAPSVDPLPSVDPMLPADPIPFAPSRRVRAHCRLDSPGRWGAKELRPDSACPLPPAPLVDPDAGEQGHAAAPAAAARPCPPPERLDVEQQTQQGRSSSITVRRRTRTRSSRSRSQTERTQKSQE